MFFLPEPLLSFVINNFSNINEIRIRKNHPVYVNFKNEYKKVILNGNPVIINDCQLEELICKLCNHSIYKYNESIRNGFISLPNGVRVGLAGECVYELNDIKTIKNFHSICVRIPHEIRGYANKAFNIINENNALKSLLIMAPPGAGKTTLLRDLIRIISDIKKSNILVIDEKNEIFYDSVFIGETVDVFSSARKEFGFYTGIKTLSPDLIVCDELVCENDAKGVAFAVNSGVKVIATVHADCVEALKSKSYMKVLLNDNIFDKFILINKNFTYEEVFLECLQS